MILASYSYIGARMPYIGSLGVHVLLSTVMIAPARQYLIVKLGLRC